MSDIVSGYDAALPVTLKKEGVVFSIDAGATVKAVLLSADRSTVIIPEVTSNNAATGADWANSLVIVEFSAAQTALVLEEGDMTLEVQVDDTKKLPWFIPLEASIGHIS